MNILAIETTHGTASVALYTEGTTKEIIIHSEKRHEETVMPAVAQLLEANGLLPEALDAVAVDIGPGSFTGVRIGVCHANAIAAANHIPCIGICSLTAMAAKEMQPGKLTSVYLDAGNDNCYGAVIDADGGFIYGPAAESTAAFKEKADALHPDREMSGKDSSVLPGAADILQCALQKITEKEDAPDVREAMPLYLRPSQAERKLKNV